MDATPFPSQPSIPWAFKRFALPPGFHVWDWRDKDNLLRGFIGTPHPEISYLVATHVTVESLPRSTVIVNYQRAK